MIATPLITCMQAKLWVRQWLCSVGGSLKAGGGYLNPWPPKRSPAAVQFSLYKCADAKRMNAMSFSSVTGLNVWISVLSAGVVCTIYTSLVRPLQVQLLPPCECICSSEFNNIYFILLQFERVVWRFKLNEWRFIFRVEWKLLYGRTPSRRWLC